MLKCFLASRDDRKQEVRVSMCPLRFILVFLSGLLAGYLAWKSLRCETSKEEEPLVDDSIQADESSEKPNSFERGIATISSGFWIFVDMASGRFLWQNLLCNSQKSKSC
eukprot:TRINITY_DN5073_c0_g1_i1.p1 TRINITY_DN5073_c0_g1~~TRINITY_DN5073_c0_g1_i1.p1  ORF type:complete len:109 (-),score=16.45 TRINITY_DN5073_c0_g1_i1:316-642(-)